MDSMEGLPPSTPGWRELKAPRASQETLCTSQDQARRLCYSQGTTCTFNCSASPNYSTREMSGEADTRVLVPYCSISPASHRHRSAHPSGLWFLPWEPTHHPSFTPPPGAGKSPAAPRSASKELHTATVQHWSFHLQGSNFVSTEEPWGVLPRRASLRSLTHRSHR